VSYPYVCGRGLRLTVLAGPFRFAATTNARLALAPDQPVVATNSPASHPWPSSRFSRTHPHASSCSLPWSPLITVDPSTMVQAPPELRT
jgi:hypothetical protein